jgi:hypothetical protein
MSVIDQICPKEEDFIEHLSMPIAIGKPTNKADCLFITMGTVATELAMKCVNEDYFKVGIAVLELFNFFSCCRIP